MKEVYVVSAARTPLGSIGGTLKNTQPEELLRVALEGAVSKAGIGKEIIDEVICGQAKQTTDAPNIARIVSLMMQIPEATPAYTRPGCRRSSAACSRSSADIPTSYLQAAWRV